MPSIKRALGVVAASAALAMVAACGAGGTNEPEKVGEVGASASAGTGEATAAKEFKVGDQVKVGDWEVAVHKVTDPLKPGEFLQPDKGKRWLRVEVEVTNLTSAPAKFYMLMHGFELQDDKNRVYDITVTGVDGGAVLDGTVAAGKSRRGSVDFEVDTDAKGLVFNFSDGLTGDSTATIKLS
ncbi:DUF4352 domain-containing protein [Catellatospora sp. NPDC049609]|uniref:DUF4352 domain-containing protein n=1 Tax=Catellatospora sp. NPDC049609 TaxID=3155505 RepID=UPI0034309419